MTRVRTALLFQDENFVGREYFLRLSQAGRTPDLLVAAGRMAPDSIARETDRTGERWTPPPIPAESQVHSFGSISDPLLWKLLRENEIQLGIQAGVGILKPEMIAALPLGILNIHPGKLPEYRGNACPEWALLNGDEVWATAHMIDQGIDTGPVVHMKKLDLTNVADYFDLRAGLYAHCAQTLIEALALIEQCGTQNLSSILKPQDEQKARYWPALGDADTKRVRQWRSR